MEFDASELWDRYREARDTDPALIPERFARELAEREDVDVAEVLAVLRLGEELEDLRPAVPLVDVADGDGTRFAGFRLKRELGRGAFGIVYEAVREDEPESEPIALKVLNPLATADAGRQRDLLREAAVGGRLDHPGIVRVVASGVERGYAWFASELAAGRPLDRLPYDRPEEAGAERLRRRALDLGLQLSEAVAHAHERGVVHRDLKPANVLVTDDGRVKVLDFGLAHADRIGASIRLSGEVVGTPLFMAPEQVTGHAVGPWSDVWALGLLLAELAAPGTTDELAASVRLGSRLVGRSRPLPRRCLKCVPADLREIVERCLEPLSVDRYSNARDLADDLAALAAGRALPHGRPGRWARGRRWVHRHSVAAAALALLVLSTPIAIYELWWMASVPVRIATFDTTKLVSIDYGPGRLSPMTRLLRPGDHKWKVLNSGPTNKGALYSGEIRVLPREHDQQFTLILDWAGRIPTVRRGPSSDYLAAEYGEVPPGHGAWLVVAVRPEAAGLEVGKTAGTVTVDGLPDGSHELPVVFRTRIAEGEHELRLSMPEHAPKTVRLDVNEDRLYFVAEALDPLGADGRATTHTMVLYSFLDERGRRALESGSTENLRPFIEHEAFNNGLHVAKPYLGLIDERERGLARLELQLESPADTPIRGVRLATSAGQGQETIAGGWLVIRGGASLDDLYPLAAWSRAPPGTLPHDFPDGAPGRVTFESPTLELRAAADAHALALEYEVGPSASGEQVSYTSALRSEALPRSVGDESSGTFLWHPALVVQVELER